MFSMRDCGSQIENNGEEREQKRKENIWIESYLSTKSNIIEK